MAALCPTLDAIGGSDFSTDGFSVTRNYRLRANWRSMTYVERLHAAEACACSMLPDSMPGMIVTQDGEIHDLDLALIDEDNEIGGSEVKCIIPDRPLSGFNIVGEAKQQKGAFDLQATYSSACGPGSREASFQTGGGRSTITQSLETERFPATACNFGGAIGVRHGGEIDGADIVAADPRLRITRCYPPGFINCRILRDLVGVTGCVNVTFWDPEVGSAFTPGMNGEPTPCFNPEELLFLGASGSSQVQGNDTITFEWLMDPQINVPVMLRSGTQNILKRGHRHLWVRYEKGIDLGCNFEVLLPEFAYVERVYRRSSFGAEFSPFGFPA